MTVQPNKSDDLRRWILKNTPAPDNRVGVTAAEYQREFPDISLPRVSNILVEMMDEGILTRRKNPKYIYEYFLIEYHDPDDYILAKQSSVVLNNRFSAITGEMNKAKKRADRIAELSRSNNLIVECECGKLISIQVEGKVIKDEDLAE